MDPVQTIFGVSVVLSFILGFAADQVLTAFRKKRARDRRLDIRLGISEAKPYARETEEAGEL